MKISSLFAFTISCLCHIHVSLEVPIDQGQVQSLNLINTTSSVTNNVLDPFIYTTGHYTFKLAARPSPHRTLEQETLSRLKDGLDNAIARALKRGADAEDPVPDDSIYIKDLYSGAYLHVVGNREAPAPPYELKWIDLSTLESALIRYLRHWKRVKRSSLVDIWIYSRAELLLAKGTAERGWPFEPSPSLMVAKSVIS